MSENETQSAGIQGTPCIPRIYSRLFNGLSSEYGTWGEWRVRWDEDLLF